MRQVSGSGLAHSSASIGLDGALGEVDLHQPVEDIVDDQPALDVVADHGAEIAELAAEHADAQIALALRDRGRTAGAEQKSRAERTGRSRDA